ncbi:MAG TPA: phage tail length tape measure family protein [Rhodanobacter sp.]
MAASDDEIIVTLTMQAAQFQQAAQEAGITTEGLAAQLKAANIDIVGQGAALMRLDAAFAAPINTAKQLAAAEAALDEAMRTGAITAEQQAAYLDQLSASQAAVAETAELATAATEELSAAQTISGGVAREIGVLMGELARGNYTRLEGSTITLANRTGLLARAFSPLGLAVLATGGSLVAMIAWMAEGAEEADKLRASLIATGDSSGYTYGQLRQLADSLRSSVTTAGEADEAVLKLSQSGRFMGDSLAEAARGAVSMAALTGQSIDQAVAEFEKLTENPVKALKTLNDQYNLISPTEAAEIKRLQDEGNVAEAAARAIRDVAQAEQQRTVQLAAGEGYMGRFVNSWKSGFSNMKAAVMDWGAPETVQQQLADVTREINDFSAKNQGRLTQLDGKIQFDSKGLLPYQIQRVNSMLERYDELTKQVTADQQKQQQVASQSAKNKDAVDGTLGADTTTKDLEGELRKQEADQQVSYDKRLQFEQTYWQNVLMSSKEGSAQYIEAWQRVQSIQEQVDNARTSEIRRAQEAEMQATRQAAAAHRQMAAQVMNDLEEQRAATVANTAERIQADATILASATRLYGAMSSEQRRAVQQMIADGRSYDAAVLQQQEAALQTQMRVDQAAANEKRAAAQQALADGQITAQQALAIEQAANQQALNSYAQYIAAKVALDQGSIPALNKDAQDWVSFSASMTKRMQQDQQTATRQIQQQWMQTFRPITQAFDQSITGMIQGTKTLSQAWRSLLSDLLMSEVRSGAQMVARWAATELAKTGATMAGNAARTASNEAAARIGMQQSAEMSEKQIFNAAYTAAANTYQSVSQIPYVGWIMAPIAAAGAFTAVMAFDNIASAAGGWGSVPYDDAPALLHRNEMVLPATLADRVRGMTDAGGATGGNQNIHVHANDARSFGQLLQRDPHMFAKAAKKAMRVQRNRP